MTTKQILKSYLNSKERILYEYEEERELQRFKEEQECQELKRRE